MCDLCVCARAYFFIIRTFVFFIASIHLILAYTFLSISFSVLFPMFIFINNNEKFIHKMVYLNLVRLRFNSTIFSSLVSFFILYHRRNHHQYHLPLFLFHYIILFAHTFLIGVLSFFVLFCLCFSVLRGLFPIRFCFILF